MPCWLACSELSVKQSGEVAEGRDVKDWLCRKSEGFWPLGSGRSGLFGEFVEGVSVQFCLV